MALVEGCRHSLEISVPVDTVESETERVVSTFQQRAKLPGFRPGKAPPGLIRKQFEGDIRQKVLENLVPKFLERELEKHDLRIVGTPDISDVHFHHGEPLRFKAEFEVFPEIELKDYRGLSVPYHDPQITDDDVAKRLEEIRDQKADYSNVDPRPIQDGDHAVISIESLSGTEGQPVKQDEMMLHVGAEDTLAAFTENLRGMTQGEEKDFDVTYPESYGQPKLAGRTIRFHAKVKGIRKKELPEVNDEFAQDLGDFRTVEELREALRKSLFAQRQLAAQQEAKNKLVDKLVDLHEFPIPEAFIDRQVRNRVEQTLHSLAAEGVDASKIQLDWQKMKSSQRDKALREVKASLLLSRVAEREAIAATRDEVDKEVERIAKQQREPFAAVRLRFEKDGTLGRIASHIQTEKTLNFLFEHAQKTAED
ncbi:MAG TPA: trigger factor [Bryobacteraceae bacterium]|nr:trigger factor [Bryobacteraceae bacterium]